MLGRWPTLIMEDKKQHVIINFEAETKGLICCRGGIVFLEACLAFKYNLIKVSYTFYRHFTVFLSNNIKM